MYICIYVYVPIFYFSDQVIIFLEVPQVRQKEKVTDCKSFFGKIEEGWVMLRYDFPDEWGDEQLPPFLDVKTGGNWSEKDRKHILLEKGCRF